VRLLFTFAGGNGHFEPLVPVARAAELAGHTVAFAGQPVMISAIEAAGFTAFATAGLRSATHRSNGRSSQHEARPSAVGLTNCG
jgi:UDP:flavonoid glycosyltransferase YjiC (YdhE family)